MFIYKGVSNALVDVTQKYADQGVALGLAEFEVNFILNSNLKIFIESKENFYAENKSLVDAIKSHESMPSLRTKKNLLSAFFSYFMCTLEMNVPVRIDEHKVTAIFIEKVKNAFVGLVKVGRKDAETSLREGEDFAVRYGYGYEYFDKDAIDNAMRIGMSEKMALRIANLGREVTLMEDTIASLPASSLPPGLYQIAELFVSKMENYW